jgi:hypothetical protein
MLLEFFWFTAYLESTLSTIHIRSISRCLSIRQCHKTFHSHVTRQ